MYLWHHFFCLCRLTKFWLCLCAFLDSSIEALRHLAWVSWTLLIKNSNSSWFRLMSLSYCGCFDPFDKLPPSNLSFFAFVSSFLTFTFLSAPATIFFFAPVFAFTLPIVILFELSWFDYPSLPINAKVRSIFY